MAVILLIVENQKEEDILKLFLEQSSFQIVLSKPNYANYIKSVQYKPSLILLEMPSYYTDQINYVRMVLRNKHTCKIPIVAYGDHQDDLVVKSFLSSGVKAFLQRPLKTKVLMQHVRSLLQAAGQKVSTPKQEEQQNRAEDMETILNPSTLATKKIDIMAGYVKKMLAFPFTIAKVLKITANDDSGAGDLAKAIQADPVVTTTILKLSNTVLFASRDRRISDVKEAIVRIGFRETKNIAMSLSVMKLFTKEEKSIGFDRVEFWYHSLASAVLAEKIAKNAGHQRSEEAFISGLLHDFGILLLDEFFGELFARIMEKTTQHGNSFVAEENTLLGINHTDVTQKLFEDWKMPDTIAFAVKNHYDFLTLGEKVDPRNALLAKAVGIANMVAKSAQLGRDVDMVVHPIPNEMLKEMKYSAGFKEMFYDDVNTQLNMYNQFLKIDERKFPTPSDGMADVDPMHIAFVDRANSLFNPFQLFLSSQGYPLRQARTCDDIERLEPAANVIVVCTAKDDTLQSIQSFLEIKNGGACGDDRKKDEVDAQKESIVPVVVVHGNREEFRKIKGKGKAKAIEEPLDLRNLERTVWVALGKEEERSGGDEYLRIGFRDLGDVSRIVDLEGSLRIATLGDLRDSLVSLIRGPVRNLALNFEKVDYVDSSGVRLVVNLHKRMQSKKGKVCLMKVADEVMTVLKATNLDKILSFADTQEDLATIFDMPLPPEPAEAMQEMDKQILDDAENTAIDQPESDEKRTEESKEVAETPSPDEPDQNTKSG